MAAILGPGSEPSPSARRTKCRRQVNIATPSRAAKSSVAPLSKSKGKTGDVNHFAEWLSHTSFSLAIQTHEWIIPTIQSIHIVAIGVTLASVFMIDLRILGWAGRDQTLIETTVRFGPWLSGALGVLLVTGGLMVIGEPMRELLAFSFWLKMCLVTIGIALAAAFQ